LPTRWAGVSTSPSPAPRDRPLRSSGDRTTTSVVMVSHDSADLVRPVLDALFSDPVRPAEVIVVDSASTDGTLDVLADFDVKVIHQEQNVGFAAGCHIGAESAQGEILVFLGHDTIPEPGWLGPLVAALDSPDVGAAMATIEDARRPGTFNTSGGHLTYFGIGWVSDFGEPIPDESEPVDVAFPSGAAMAIRRGTWEAFGGFRRPFFTYQEDADLGWRLRLAGMRIVRVPKSRVLHRYDFGRSPAKMYHLERNRWLMLRSNYRRRTLVVLSPALLLVEVGTTLIASRDGWLSEKLRAWRDASRAGAVVREGRVLVDANRSLSDAAMIATMDFRLSGMSQITPPPGVGLVDRFLGLWQRVALAVLRFLDRTRRVS
ncbi:MAG: glycosyltransferase family 2 protein, partial [Acidimicrobiia bacterium]